MNILSIGNSFSQDAQRYLSRIARADGVKLTTFNLYIGGCPLSRHYRNMMGDVRDYILEMNGDTTGFPMSIKEALLSRNWDMVTLQQVSSESVDYSTYQPYLDSLVEYVRKLCPKAKIVLHETWAYLSGSVRLTEEMGYTDCSDMYLDIKKAYESAAADIKADMVIPSGSLVQYLVDAGVDKLYRDNFHASRGTGRYALGLLWYNVLTGNSVSGNTFADFDEEIPADTIELIKDYIDKKRYVK